MVRNAVRLYTVEEANGLLDFIGPLLTELSDYSVKQEMLEEQLEELLFVRKGKQLELTSAGRKLLKNALKILALNDVVFAEFEKRSLTGKVRFGIPSEFATTLLPKILGIFTQSYPSVNLEVNCALSKELLSQARDDYDLVLALQSRLSRKRTTCLKEDELVWVSGTNHNTHMQTPVNLVLAPEPCVYRARALERLRKSGGDWRITYTNSDLTGIQTAINEGLGITVLAKSTVPKSLRILQNSDKFPKLGTVGIHLRYDTRTTNEALLRLVEYIRAII